MADNQPANQPARRTWLAGLLLAGGAGLVGLSFVWPAESSSRANWSLEQAKAYQAASIKLHSLSHETAGAAGSTSEKAVREKLDAAKAEYDALRGELDSAIDRPKHISLAMRIAGFLLAAIGAGLIFYNKPADR